MKKPSDKYPNAKLYRDRHGNRRWRYRVKGFTAELGTNYGSDEFERRYEDAETGSKSKGQVGAGRTIPRSLDDLVAHFYKLHFPTIEESTRADYRSVIELLRSSTEKSGSIN